MLHWESKYESEKLNISPVRQIHVQLELSKASYSACEMYEYILRIHTGNIAPFCDNSKPWGFKDHNVLRRLDNTKSYFQLQLFPDLCLQVLNMKCENAFYSLRTQLSCLMTCYIFFFFFTKATPKPKARIYLFISSQY